LLPSRSAVKEFNDWGVDFDEKDAVDEEGVDKLSLETIALADASKRCGEGKDTSACSVGSLDLPKVADFSDEENDFDGVPATTCGETERDDTCTEV
jgi:hypothetical protein